MRAGRQVRAALEGSIWCADASTRTHVSNIKKQQPQDIPNTTTPANVWRNQQPKSNEEPQMWTKVKVWNQKKPQHCNWKPPRWMKVPVQN